MVAAEAMSRSLGFCLPVINPRKAFLEVPIKTRYPVLTNTSMFFSRAKLCSSVLPKPMPGSMKIWSFGIPDFWALAALSSRKSRTSVTTSLYCGSCCIVCGSLSMCIKVTGVFSFAASLAMSGLANAVMSLIIEAPAAIAAAAT